MKRFIAVLAVALAVAVGTAYAASAPLVIPQILGGAQLSKPFTIHVTKPGQLIFAQVKILPGGSFGWHSHRSAVAVAVVAGTLTLYDSSDPNCTPQAVAAGHGFVEPANHVHLARNDGQTTVRVLVAYLGAPTGVSPDVPAAAPAACASVK